MTAAVQPLPGVPDEALEAIAHRRARFLPDRVVLNSSTSWSVGPGRYRLVAAEACPWSNRLTILRRILGLQPALSEAIVGPLHDKLGWNFHLSEGGRDPVLGITHLREAYVKRYAAYQGVVTVPTLVEISSGEAVANDFFRLAIELVDEWQPYHAPGAPDIYPLNRRDEIDNLSVALHYDVNAAVYRSVFASSEEERTAARDRLYTRLLWLENRLATSRYLLGDWISLTDVFLFVTLIRFDVVYNDIFGCDRIRIGDMPALAAYTARLLSQPEFGETIDLANIVRHYQSIELPTAPRSPA